MGLGTDGANVMTGKGEGAAVPSCSCNPTFRCNKGIKLKNIKY